MSGSRTDALLLTERFIKETGTEAGVAELTEPVLESLGFRLVQVRILHGQGTVVEILAERPDGSMTIDDCRTVSLALSPVLDVHDPLPGSYRLEISSPGIDRPLVRPTDFDQWAGFEARIELSELIDGRKRFRGILEGFDDGEVRIEVDLGKDQGVKLLGLPISLIAEAKLVLTDQLIRESLRRTKRELAALQQGDIDGLDVGDASIEIEPDEADATDVASEADSKSGAPDHADGKKARPKAVGPGRSSRRSRPAGAPKRGIGRFSSR